MPRKSDGAVSLEEVVEIVGEVVDLSGLFPDEDAVLGDDIPTDSKEMLRILSRIESRYRFRFLPSDITALRTMGDLVEAIRRRAG